jgi:hypothetical protein
VKNLAVDPYGREILKNFGGFGKRKRQNSLEDFIL